jgi:uncharacterized protein
MAKKTKPRGKVPKKAQARKAPPAKAKAKRAKKDSPSRREAARPHARGGVVHWELLARDQDKQQAFYSDLFGWKVNANNPMEYGMVPPAGEGSIGGGFSTVGAGQAPYVTIYVGVPSIIETLAKVTALGGTPTMQRTDLGMVIMAQFRDLEGNLIGLVEG